MIHTSHEISNRIRSLLTQLAVETSLRNKSGLTDFAHGLENFFCGLLFRAYGLPFSNMNLLQKNYPAIDLVGTSPLGKIAMQVTSENSTTKLKETIERFEKNGLHHNYQFLTFLIVSDKAWTTKWTPPILEGVEVDVLHITTFIENLTSRVDSTLAYHSQLLSYIQAHLLGYLEYPMDAIWNVPADDDFDIAQNFINCLSKLDALIAARHDHTGRVISEELKSALASCDIALSDRAFNNYSKLRCRHQVLRSFQERVRNVVQSLAALLRGPQWVLSASRGTSGWSSERATNDYTFLLGHQLSSSDHEHCERISFLFNEFRRVFALFVHQARTI